MIERVQSEASESMAKKTMDAVVVCGCCMREAITCCGIIDKMVLVERKTSTAPG